MSATSFAPALLAVSNTAAQTRSATAPSHAQGLSFSARVAGKVKNNEVKGLGATLLPRRMRNSRLSVSAKKDAKKEAPAPEPEAEAPTAEAPQMGGIPAPPTYEPNATPQYTYTMTPAPPPAPPPASSGWGPWIWVGIGIAIATGFQWLLGFAKSKQADMQTMMMQQMLKNMQGGAAPGMPGMPMPGAPGAPGGMPGWPTPPPPTPAPGMWQPPPPTPTPTPSPPPPTPAEFTPSTSEPPPTPTPTPSTSAAASAAASTAKPEEKKDSEKKPEAAKADAGFEDAFEDVDANASDKPAGEGYEYTTDVKEAEVVGGSAGGAAWGSGASDADGDEELQMLIDMMQKPEMQQIILPTLPEGMRDPETFNMMLQNPMMREQLKAQFKSFMDPKQMEELKRMNSPDVQQQFAQMGVSQEEMMAKLTSDPELLQAFQNPKVSQAIMDISSNPQNASKYVGDPEVMKVMMKLSTMFPAPPGGMPGGMPGQPGAYPPPAGGYPPAGFPPQQ